MVMKNAPESLYGSQTPLRTANEHVRFIQSIIKSCDWTTMPRNRYEQIQFVNWMLHCSPDAFPSNVHRFRKRSRYMAFGIARQVMHTKATFIQKWWRENKRRRTQSQRQIVNDVDPFTLEPIAFDTKTPGGTFVFASAGQSLPRGHVYCFKTTELVEYIIHSGRTLNPFTREPLSDQTLFDAALICARENGHQWFELRQMCTALEQNNNNNNIRTGRSLLEIASREVRRREAIIANRIAAAQVLEDSVRSVASTVIQSIWNVNRTTRPFRALNPRFQALQEQLPRLSRANAPPPPRLPLPQTSFHNVREYPGSNAMMNANEWASADVTAWVYDWIHMDMALHSAGISRDAFTEGLDSLISGFNYLRQANIRRFRIVIRIFVQWLRFILDKDNPLIGPTAREITRRITWIIIARGVPLALPSREVQAAVHFNENEFHRPWGNQIAQAEDFLLNSFLRSASIVFR